MYGISLAKGIFNLELGIMKNQLKLAEFRFGTKESDSFKYFKEMTMNHFYEATKRFFQDGAAAGYFERCTCGANLRHGWTKCEECAGSGYKDKK